MESRPDYNAAPVLDLEALDVRAGASRGFDLELRHPATGAALGVHITVLGTDSSEYQDKMRELTLRRLDLASRRKADPAALTAQAEQDALDLLSVITRGWRGLRQGGVELAYSTSAARELYHRYPWIREQVEAASRDRANFLPGCAPG